MTSDISQKRFEKVYRGRQSIWHHASYMRMAKVLLGFWMLKRHGFHGGGKKIFDYGFGAGTFFRFFPKTAHLYGVEQDPQICLEVSASLQKSGFRHIHLKSIAVGEESRHPFLAETYDLIILSHVLEHLPDPADWLGRMRACLSSQGMILGLVPIHERAPNPHHLHSVDQAVVKRWADISGLRVLDYQEADPWLYWLQPLYTADDGWMHLLAKSASLALGLPATICGAKLWHLLGCGAEKLFFTKPTQAVFLLTR